MKSRQALWVGDSQEDVSDRIKPLVTPTTSAIEPFGKEKKNTAEEETPSSKQKCPLCNQLISKCITDIHSSLCQGPSILSKIADDEDVSDVEELPVQEYRTTKPASDVKNNNYKNNSETTFTAIKPSNSPICSTVAVMPSFASCHASNFMCANTPATSAHNLVQCPLCMAEYPQSVIQMHANLCLENSVVY